MKNRKLRLIVGTIVLFVALVSLFVAGVGFTRSAQLNHSLEVLLRERLNLASARITQSALAPWETDTNGFWAVVVDEMPSKIAIALRDAGFGQSDDFDEPYFRSLLRNELNGGDLTAHHAFEAHLTLGDGTICETYSCTVIILFTDESPTIFIAIWRI
jgi:hypothetical protein